MTSIDIEKCLTEEGEALYCASLSSEFKQNLKTSLKLEDRGKNGSVITWSSSDEDVINTFGRVTRPKSNAEPKNVRLTAKMELFGKTKLFEFDFCVPCDETFYDPQHISDEEFFGGGTHGEKAFLNYKTEGLEKVGDSALKGDYKAAKQELLSYFKSHDRKPYLGEKKDSCMVEMMTGGMQCLQRSDRLFRGKVTAETTEFTQKSVPLNTDGVKPGATLSLAIVSRFNECCGLCIASKDCDDKNMRPRLLIKTNAGDFEIPCKDNAVLNPANIAEFNQDELFVKNFGKFLGDETYVSILKFEPESLAENAEITDVLLELSVKKDVSLSGSKEAYIVLFAQNTWDGKTAKWSDFLWQFANRTGICEKDEFDAESGFDFEYFFQRVRFMYFRWAVLEYEQSHDENILYALIRTMCNFIEAKGNMRTYSGNWHIGYGWYDDKVNQSLTAGWPRALDSAQRLSSFAECLPYLTQSEFMTEEVLCCALKYIRDGICGIIYKSTTILSTNLRMFELMGALKALCVYPEFADSKKYFADAVEIIKNLMLTVTFSDGTYMEATGGYSNSVCLDFVDFYKTCYKNNVTLSEEFIDRFRKFAIYNVLIQGPDGESIQYGDQSSEKNAGWQYPELIDIYKDDVLSFILTRGDIGKKPEWTSCRFPESSAAVLRDSWDKTATYLWTQARGGGSHGHQDDHHITLISENRVLLCDAGIFTYSSEDPYRQWGTSPKAHNTIIIDGIEQKRGSGSGKLNCFETNDEFDRLSQTSCAYTGFEFTRSITWHKKEDVIFVEDTVKPEDENASHTYRQAWHMMPTAKMSLNTDGNVMMSNYADGVNIKITLLDPDGEPEQEQGWYDYGYQQLTDNPFGCFVKKERKGKVSFRTKIELIRPNQRQ